MYRAYILSLEYVRYTNIPRLPRLPVIMYYSSFYIVAQYLWFVCQNYIYCLAISIHTQLALLACILLLGRFIVCKNSMGMISCIIIDGILIFYWRNYWMEYGYQRKKHCCQVLFEMSSSKCNLKLKPFENESLFPISIWCCKIEKIKI